MLFRQLTFLLSPTLHISLITLRANQKLRRLLRVGGPKDIKLNMPHLCYKKQQGGLRGGIKIANFEMPQFMEDSLQYAKLVKHKYQQQCIIRVPSGGTYRGNRQKYLCTWLVFVYYYFRAVGSEKTEFTPTYFSRYVSPILISCDRLCPLPYYLPPPSDFLRPCHQV